MNIYSRTNTSPFMVVEGTLSEPKDWYIVCEKKWQLTKSPPKISGDRLNHVSCCLLYLLPGIQDVLLALTMNFLQGKLTNPVSIAPKTHYNNLFRSVTLFEQVTPNESSA